MRPARRAGRSIVKRVMASLRQKSVIAENSALGRLGLCWQDVGIAKTSRLYLFRFASYHLRRAGEYDDLWTLLCDPDYQTAQIQAFDGFIGAAVSSLREGVEAYARRQGQNEDDDPRLCWLALRCAETVQQCRNNLRQIFRDFQASDLDPAALTENALRRLASFDDPTFLAAGLLLLLIGASPELSGRTAFADEHLRNILIAIKKRLPRRIEIQDTPLTAWLAGQLSALIPLDTWTRLPQLVDRADPWRQEAVLTLLDRRRWGDAIAIASQIEGNPSRALTTTAIAEALIGTGRAADAVPLLSDALAAAQLVESYSFEAYDALGTIADALGLLGQTHGAEGLFTRLIKHTASSGHSTGQVRTFVAVAVALNRLGKKEWAARVFEQVIEASMSLTVPVEQVRSLVAIAVALQRSGDVDGAEKVFGLAITAMERIKRDYDFRETVVAMSDLVINAGPEGTLRRRASQVIDACRKMQEPGCQAEALAVLAATLAQSNHPEWAADLLDEAQGALSKSRHPAIVSSASLAVVRALSRLGRHGAALQAAEHIEGTLDKAEALGVVAACLVRSGQPARAVELVRHLNMASYYQAIPHVRIVAALMEAGNTIGALLELDSISDCHSRSHAVSAIASRASQATFEMYEGFHSTCPAIQAVAFTPETLPGVLNTVGAMKDPRHRFQLLAAMARSLETKEQTVAATGVLRRTVSACLDALHASQQPDTQATRYQDLIQVCAALVDSKQYEAAQNATSLIQDSLQRADELLAIASAASVDGEVSRTINATEAAIRAGDEVSSRCKRVRLFCAAAESLFRAAKPARALHVLEHAIGAADQLPGEGQPFRTIEAPNIDQSECFGLLAVTFAGAGRFQQAMAQADKVPNPSHRVDVMESIIKVLIAGGDFRAAGEAAARMQQLPDARVRGTAWLAAARAHEGHVDQGFQLFSDALRLTEEKPASPPMTLKESVLAITEALAQAGEFADRAIVLAKLMQIAAEIRHYPSRGEALIKIIQSLRIVDGPKVRIGLLFQALEAVTAVRQTRWQAKVLFAIAKALAGVEHSAEFEQAIHRLVELAQGITETRCRVAPLASTAQTLAQTGHLPWAGRLFEAATAISEELNADLDREEAIATIASQMADGGDPEPLHCFSNRLLKLALSIQDLGRRSNSLAVVLRASLKGGIRLTEQLLDSIESVALSEESLGWIVAFSIGVSQTGETGLPLLRKATILSAQRPDLTLLLGTGMVAAYIRSGKTHRAKEIVRKCPQLRLTEILK